MRRRNLPVGVAAALALCALAVPASAVVHDDEPPPERGAREVEEAQPRLVVADGVEPKAAVVDLGTRRVLTRVPLATVASLAPAGDGRHVLAVQTSRNQVKVIDGGSWAVPHGDHSHHYVRAPRGQATIAGNRPIHVVAHGSRVAIFNDGTGVAAVIRSATIARGAKGALRVASGSPHHGVAVPVGTRTLITTKTGAGDDLPGELALASATGTLGGSRLSCPELHGEGALSTTRVLFACANGYLVATVGQGVRGLHVPLPAGLGAEARSFSVSTAEGLSYAIGDLDATSLARIDIAKRTSSVLATPGRHGAFVLDPASRSVLVVTDDGRLHQIDPASGAVRASVAAVTPFSLEGSYSIPRPKIALGTERRVYVSDPIGRRVVEIATNPLRVTRQIAVGGTPNSIAVVGLDGAH